MSDQDRQEAIQQALAGVNVGDTTSITELVGETLFINGFTETSGKFGEFIVIEAVKVDGTEIKVRTGSAVVKDQLKRLELAELLPESFVVASAPGKIAGSKMFKLEPVT